MAKPVVAVNGRFLTMTATGVQRYAHEILPRLQPDLVSELRVVVPPNRVLEAGDPALGEIGVTKEWHGINGHRWEQLTLPRLARKARAGALWSPCQWGPVAVRRQMPVIHDIAPLTHPEYYTRAYRVMARAITRPLVRRSAVVATPSMSVRQDLIERFRVDEDRVLTIPPGVGPPFSTRPLGDLGDRGGRYCILVGAHDSRKNPEFLLALWPEVHASTGLELHLTRRSLVTGRREQDFAELPEGVTVHVDPGDDELAELYAQALCLLWPSHYEGYGFPLLEAMAVGTPFLATDVGAASELAVAPEQQILPLDHARWREQIEAWHQRGVDELRAVSVERARAQTWEAAATASAAALDRLAERET